MHREFFRILWALVLSPAAVAQSVVYDFQGAATGDLYGSAVATAGDVDGDGFEDLVIGGSQALVAPGYVQVLSGLRGTVLWAALGDAAGDMFGSAVAGIGDVDGDQKSDVAVGAHLATPVGTQRWRAGIVRIFSGATGQWIRDLEGDADDDHFGWSVAAAGDVDGDLIPDVIAGAIDADPQGSSSGRTRVFSGFDGSEIHTFDGAATSEFFGYSVAGVGDLNNDGRAELCVGAPGIPTSQQTGWARLFSGLDGQVMHTWYGDSVDDGFGSAVASAGDVDGDQLGDVIVGAPQPGTLLEGYARIFSGATGQPLRTLRGDQPRDRFGAAVSTAGRVDTDAFADVLVGAPLADDFGTSSGEVAVVSVASGAVLRTIYGQAAGHRMGQALAGNVDVNLDGSPEFLISSTGDSASGANSGSARLYAAFDLPLESDRHLLSISQGALTGHLEIDFSPAFAGRNYRVLGSITGILPSTPIAGLQVPLVSDRYFLHLIGGFNARPVQRGQGVLDSSGRASADFLFPPLLNPADLLGRTFYHASIAMDASGAPVAVSNAVPLTIVP